jgi:hypothetical protein
VSNMYVKGQKKMRLGYDKSCSGSTLYDPNISPIFKVATYDCLFRYAHWEFTENIN